MAQKFMHLEGGKKKLKEATVTSAGVGNAGDIPALDAGGKLSESVMPAGVSADVITAEASEALVAGDYVNVWNDGGTLKARKADNSNGRDAIGYVKAGFAVTETAEIYNEGPNANAPTGTVGDRAYLGTAGGVITTPLDPATDGGKIHQYIGKYVGANEINMDLQDCIVL